MFHQFIFFEFHLDQSFLDLMNYFRKRYNSALLNFFVVSDCWPLEFFDLFVFLTFFFNFWPFVLLTFKYHDFFIDLFFLPFYLLTFKYYDFLTLLFISIWPLHLSTERSNWNRQKGQKIVIFKGQKVKKEVNQKVVIFKGQKVKRSKKRSKP